MNLKTLLSLPLFLLLLCAPADAVEPELLSAEDLQEDFHALYAGLQSAHYDLFANRTKDQYDALFARTLSTLDQSMSRHDANVLFQKFTAFGKVAHARLDYDRSRYETYRENGGAILPLYLRIADGRMYVEDNRSDDRSLTPGTEILEINGESARAWLARTGEYVSADTDYITESLLEYWFNMYLWEALGPVDQFDLTVLGTDQKKRSVSIAALNTEAMQANTSEHSEYFSLDGTERAAQMLDDAVAYLRPGPFYNVEQPEQVWDNSGFVEFIDEAFATFIDAGAEQLIIDLRNNPGGDNSFSDVMVAWFADQPFKFASAFYIRSSKEAKASNQARLDANPGQTEGVSVFFGKRYEEVPFGERFEFPIPEAAPRKGERFEGAVYVLIDRHSYSNAVNVAALIQDYGFGEIMGEKTADFATTYGAMETFSLPNTGFIVGFPKAHIIRPSGDLKNDGVTPDVVLTSPIVPTKTDVVLEAALEHIAAM
ncbi:MAG: S41 family peptidase [Pseudomonadota bacterium]